MLMLSRRRYESVIIDGTMRIKLLSAAHNKTAVLEIKEPTRTYNLSVDFKTENILNEKIKFVLFKNRGINSSVRFKFEVDEVTKIYREEIYKEFLSKVTYDIYSERLKLIERILLKSPYVHTLDIKRVYVNKATDLKEWVTILITVKNIRGINPSQEKQKIADYIDENLRKYNLALDTFTDEKYPGVTYKCISIKISSEG